MLRAAASRVSMDFEQSAGEALTPEISTMSGKPEVALLLYNYIISSIYIIIGILRAL